MSIATDLEARGKILSDKSSLVAKIVPVYETSQKKTKVWRQFQANQSFRKTNSQRIRWLSIKSRIHRALASSCDFLVKPSLRFKHAGPLWKLSFDSNSMCAPATLGKAPWRIRSSTWWARPRSCQIIFLPCLMQSVPVLLWLSLGSTASSGLLARLVRTSFDCHCLFFRICIPFSILSFTDAFQKHWGQVSWAGSPHERDYSPNWNRFSSSIAWIMSELTDIFWSNFL